MIFESHAHYDDAAFDADREELLNQCRQQGIETIINVSASLDSIKSTLALAEKYPFIYGAAGVHPDEVGALNEETFAWLREQCRHPKIAAVGEIGLDYYWDKEKHELQKYWFCRQMELAKELDMPIQLEVMSGSSGTNAWPIQVSREGVATAVVSIPERYMHTPVEVVHRQDLEDTAKLLAAFVESLGRGDKLC